MKTAALGLGLLLVLSAFSLGVAPSAGSGEELDPQSVAIGNGLFRSYCASCHGSSAKGDGQVAQYLKVAPSDLTKIAERNGGEFDNVLVRQIIDGRKKVRGHGHGEMPVWGDAFLNTPGGMTKEQVTERIGQLADYLESIQK